MKLQDAFNETRTDNGDRAYNSTKNDYLDVIFSIEKLKKNPKETPVFLDKEKEFDRWFARMVRDPRKINGGMGQRELGRNLMNQVETEPVDMLISGRADDIFEAGWKLYKYNKLSKGGKYWEFLGKILKRAEKIKKSNEPEMKMALFNVTKWLPRVNGKTSEANNIKARAFRDVIGLTANQYQKAISNHETVESILSRGEKVTNYETVPSLARLRHKTEFEKDPLYAVYIDKVAKGEAKIATGTMSVYDIAKNYYENNISAMEADVFFNSLPKADLGKMIAIVDNSGSMYDSNKSFLKARAVGHYIAKNTSYLTNHFIKFSDNAKLLKLGNNYESDMEVLNSFRDVGSTNFGNVMKILSSVTKDLPDYIVVLSDMQFNIGSADSKDEAMKILRKRNPNLKIVWWNFDVDRATAPETDEYGNIFMGGYNANLLEFLEHGFDGIKFVKKLVKNYKDKIEKLQ